MICDIIVLAQQRRFIVGVVHLLVITTVLGLSASLHAQTNTFPASGNVGIGTTSPNAPLTIGAPAGHSVWSTAYVGMPADSIYGLIVGRTGQAYSMELLLGVNQTSQYTTIQSNQYGCCDSPLAINPGGGNVGIGTTSPQQLLDVAGTMAAREIIVSQTGADYVFDPGYRLAPLTEVADYIKENHHLPDVPSAAEMQQKGASVGEMQAKLLAKVEELTLHMIAADAHNKTLEQQNRELQERIARLESAASDPAKGAK
jgi:hypothetical protein